MASSGFRIPPRQRHVDAGDFVHLEACADRLDAAERFQQRSQIVRRDAEHFDVDVAGSQTEQSIAYPAANEERTATRCLNRLSDRYGDIERHWQSERSIEIAWPFGKLG